jgi:predicted transcriptional regulator
MAESPPFHGEVQSQVMAAVWRLGSGTVEQVRGELPARYRGAYNTVQTTLNRLAERGLLTRVKIGHSYAYRPAVAEADYLLDALSRTLAGASTDARRTALARLIGTLDDDTLSELNAVRRPARRLRRTRPPR